MEKIFDSQGYEEPPDCINGTHEFIEIKKPFRYQKQSNIDLTPGIIIEQCKKCGIKVSYDTSG